MTKYEDHMREGMARARSELADHQIVRSSPGRWLVKKKPQSSIFWYEVVVLEGGHLLVHGDIQAVIFGRFHGSDKGTQEENFYDCVAWMASRKTPDDHYFVEKATIGGTNGHTIWEKSEEVLREEIQALIQETCRDEVDEDGHVDSKVKERREDLEAALENVGTISHEDVQVAIYEALDSDSEGVPEGRQISSDMIYAHAALQRLLTLLNEARSRAQSDVGLS